MVTVSITASSFLKRMVRNIVGVLVAVGEGDIEADHVRFLLNVKDRRIVGQMYAPAPSQGLFLKEVRYEEGKIKAKDRSIQSKEDKNELPERRP